MASISVAGDTSGSITISAPAVSGSNTLTLPVATDTLAGIAATQTLTNKTLTAPTITGATITVAATAAPAFSAYQSALNQTLATNTATKISFNTEEFDTNSNYDSATNFRFTPTVAGYYQVTINIGFTTAQGTTETGVNLYKNGSAFKIPVDSLASAYFYGGTTLVYLNGSTDYIEAYASTANAGTKQIANNSIYCYFQAFLARSA